MFANQSKNYKYLQIFKKKNKKRNCWGTKNTLFPGWGRRSKLLMKIPIQTIFANENAQADQ